jgi:hypothetical protein
MTARLTETDRRTISAARELAAITGDAAKERADATELAVAYAVVFGEARGLLTELAAIAERVTGGEGQDGEVSEDTGRLDRIRDLLARFDWEHDDRQYALEAIERIVGEGESDAG